MFRNKPMVLEAPDPDLWAPVLSGEDTVERAARQAAAADIADDLLAAQPPRPPLCWLAWKRREGRR